MTSPSAPIEPSTADLPEDVQALLHTAAYLGEDERALLVEAWRVGAAAHAGQTRKSGEPYITHPVAVACVLAEMRVDVEALVAAILHDTLEDTPLQREELVRRFGESVAELVDGVTKLDKLRFANRQEADAESFRKMMLAMARDLRVILIKLADRLHNMRTLGAQSGEARVRIAHETLDVYAPIAHRLGMNRIKAELQALGFRALHPWRYAVLEKRIRSQPLVRRESMAEIEARLAQRLAADGIEHRLVGRVKSPWSIYRKMREEHKTFSQVMDVFGFRVIVRDVPACYVALGVVHGTYKPVDARFRDFIAIPKANGYQSLHTVLFGPYGAPVEVQIRTEDMDHVAESGIAAHWLYKGGSGSSAAQQRAQAWINALIESQQRAGSSLEFLENVKVDLFPDDIYVFTPKGAIRELPRNGTALDFAYAVHTDVGNHAVAARVDGKLVPLRTRLVSGQRVEIVTAQASLPQPQWMEFVVTSKARTAIRYQLKQLGHEDAVKFGHHMLDRALEQLGSSLERVPAGRVDAYLIEHKLPRLEALLANIALGNRMPAAVAAALLRDEHSDGHMDAGIPAAAGDERILIDGSERGILSFSQCCTPIPGDAIMGYHTAGKGIAVHRASCPNVGEYRRFPERCLAMGWDRSVQGDFDAAIRVDVDNRPGVLAQVAAAIAQAESNISAVEYLERHSAVSSIRFAIEVVGDAHLERVLNRVSRLAVTHAAQRL